MNTINKVIDVSYHQGIIDWNKVKESGLADAVIIRCGYRGYATGALMEDTQFQNNINGALKHGIPVGIYFYSTALSAGEAKEEAEFTIRLIRDYNITLPVVFDYEGYNDSRYRTYKKTTQALRTAMCRAFCDAVIQHGYTTLVYGSKGMIRSKFDLSQLKDVSIWCARYAGGYSGITDDIQYFPDLGEHTSRIVMWQYTSIGSIPGIQGNVDLNNMYVDHYSDTSGSATENDPGNEVISEVLPSVDEREIYCEIAEYRNGSTPETVYDDTSCSRKIGCLDPRERCEALGVFEDRAAVLYTLNGTQNEKVGFVKWLGGCKPAVNACTEKTYRNGSSREPVYADNGAQTRIGSLDPHEECACMGIVDGMAVVRYKVNGTKDTQKIGFVK